MRPRAVYALFTLLAIAGPVCGCGKSGEARPAAAPTQQVESNPNMTPDQKAQTAAFIRQQAEQNRAMMMATTPDLQKK